MKSVLSSKTIIVSLAFAVSLSGLSTSVFAGTTASSASTSSSSSMTDQTNLEISRTLNYYQNQGVVTNGDVAFGLNALGEDVNSGPYSTDQDQFINHISASPTNLGTWAKSILSILSAGQDPKNFNGKDYVNGLLQSTFSDTYSAIYGLIALNTVGAAASSDPAITGKRDDLINYLITQNRFGDGWASWDGKNLDIDTTAAALIALAPYKDKTVASQSIGTVIDKAVQTLSQNQQDDGGFSSTYSGNNCSSLSIVIQALTALGLDPTGADFTKSKGSALSKFLSFQIDNGVFHNALSDTGDDQFATPEALQTLAALKQFQTNGTSQVFQNITYKSQQNNYKFSITKATLARSNGLKATVTVSPINGGQTGNEVVLFELMDGQTPKGMIAIQEDITEPKQVTAYFNENSSTEKIKAFVTDTLPNDPTVLGNPIAAPYIIK